MVWIGLGDRTTWFGMRKLRSAVRDEILTAIGATPAGARSATFEPAEGLLAQGSIVRRVHADFTSMMIGGIGSLLLQMLHPSALGGVWDHSDYRRDMPGRLRRTAQFISVTTYGSRTDALEMIGRVRAIHDRVQGELPDGTPYSANDPELLTWVHVAEAWCFLRSFVRYRDPALSAEDQDRYFAGMATIAHLLGAGTVPTTLRDAEQYLDGMRPRLRWDKRTRRVASELLSQPPTTPALAPFNALMFEAGIDLLPTWAAEMHGLQRRPVQQRRIRLRARGVGALLRWAMSVDTRPRHAAEA